MSPKTTFLLVISTFVLLFARTDATACPANGILCYPSDCCTQFQQCSGSTFWAPQPTPPGTVCKAGQMVWPYECTTPCGSQSETTVAPTVAPTAPAATPKPTNAATPKPTATPKPAATPKPTTTPKPAATPAPTTTPKPAATPAPTATPKPAATPAPTTPAPSSTGSSSGSCVLGQIFSENDFKSIFPNANGGAINGLTNQHAIFNYSNLIAAAAYYPAFGCTGDVTTRKRELAAFLAQTSQETSGWWAGQPYNWGYYFSTEVGCTDAVCQYCVANDQYPCATGKGYYGRGPIQLSYNYNYGPASEAIFGSSSVLLQDPDQLFSSGITAFRTALWFWMTTQDPKPSCHDIMTGGWTPSSADVALGRLPGFGMVTNVVNGGIECGVASPPAVINRVGYYTAYTTQFGVSIGDNVYCNNMKSYAY